MNWEVATFVVSAVILVMQGTSLYTIARLKYWVLDHFIRKDEVHLWMKGKRDA